MEAGSDLEKLCKFWNGKEVLYKIYGRKKLIFKENMEIIQVPGSSYKLEAHINFEGYEASFMIHLEQFNGHWVAFSE